MNHSVAIIVIFLFLLLVAGVEVSAGTAEQNAALVKATTFAYYPGLHKMEIGIAAPMAPLTGFTAANAAVLSSSDLRVITQKTFPVTQKGGYCLFSLPPMEDGSYTCTVTLGTNGPFASQSFKHKNYPWLGNNLGNSNAIYSPYTPITVQGKAANMVLRTYIMNGFGLFDSVKSEGKEILAAPITLHVQTATGEERWQFRGGKWTTKLPHLVVYETTATTPVIGVRTKSSLEYDGCMKVEMDLLPGKKMETINRMWLEIPYNDKEAAYFHYCAMEGMRRNYAGVTPRGGKISWGPSATQGWLPPLWSAQPGSDDGILWTCRDIRPNAPNTIATDFVPYIWLGSGERGLAFFGANDKGYLLNPKEKVQTIERKGDVLYLRVDLINIPSVINRPRHLVFGLQASPTKPMPEGWRANRNTPPPHGGPVVCWGGYFCSDKYPDGHNFAIVDEIIKARQTGQVDMAVFEKFDRERVTPWRFMWDNNNEPWLGGSLKYFIGINKDAHNNPGALLESYQEEHASDISNEEWEVFQDEWRAAWPWSKRTVIVDKMKPENNYGIGKQAFPESYLDFCLYYDNEYMKRGVGLYFDNTMPYTCWNPLISDAYFDENGKIQPACTIWEQRSYYKRVWTLMNELMAKHIPPFPLAFTQHVTNTCVLPLNTWNNASLDLEWRWYDEQKYTWGDTQNPIPFPPGLLLAETSGRQTGSYGHALFGVDSHWDATQTQADTARNEWGMRIVHEILRTGNFLTHPLSQKFENALREFGYGTADCRVINYWSDDPPVSVNDDATKWITVIRKKDHSLFLVLQTWHKDDTDVTVKLNLKVLGFTPASKMWDVEQDSALPVADITNFTLTLHGPYGTRVLKIGTL